MVDTITMTAWRRPEYTRRALAALGNCIGIEDVTLFIAVDGDGPPEVVEACRQVDFCKAVLLPAAERLGCQANTYRALRVGFLAGASFVVHVEDDHLLAPDALVYFGWAAERYRDDPEVFTVSSYHRDGTAAEPYRVARRPWFTSYGPWGIWADRWAGCVEGWDHEHANWDWQFNHRLGQPFGTGFRGQRHEVYPLLSRAQNIGAEGGVFCPSPEFHAAVQHVPIWAAEVDYDTGGTFFE